MTTQLPNTQSDYRAIIKSALQHLHDPAMLGTESLLATPYLLGHHLRGEAETGHSDATTRGNVLRRLIERAVATIAQDDNERPLPWARILELRYLADEPMKAA